MAHLIDKDRVVAEIKTYISNYKGILNKVDKSSDDWVDSTLMLESKIDVLQHILSFIDTLEVEKVEDIITWEDIRDISYIIEGIRNENQIFEFPYGFYKEVLKRFKAMKGE